MAHLEAKEILMKKKNLEKLVALLEAKNKLYGLQMESKP